MKKLILSLLIGILAISIPATAMEKDDNQSQQQTKSYFWTFANFIPKKLWPTAWWNDYLCTHRTSVREWHKEKAAKKVAAAENKLNKELNTSTPDPESIEYRKIDIENYKKEHPCRKLPVKLEQIFQERLTQLGYSDIPNIVEGPEWGDDANYIAALDRIEIHPSMRRWFTMGFRDECINEFIGRATHEMVHREKQHTKKNDYYKTIAVQTNKYKQDNITTALSEYSRAFETEADVLGCLNGGPEVCRIMANSHKPRTIPYKIPNSLLPVHGTIIIPENDNLHPPRKKRIKKLDQITHDMKEEDKGRCFNPNPYRKINGLPRFIDCNNIGLDKFKSEE